MPIIDIILLACFIPAIVVGATKGFVQQLVDLASVILGAWAAFHFSKTVSEWLLTMVTLDPKLTYVISFAVIVVVTVILFNLLGRAITRVIKIASLGWFNRFLGVVFGIFKTAVILGLIIMLFEVLNQRWEIISPDILDETVVYSALRDLSSGIFPYLKTFITGGTSADA